MIAGLLRDVLLPKSDLTSAIQVIVVILVAAGATFLVRRERSLVLLTIGLGLTVVGLMSLRTLH